MIQRVETLPARLPNMHQSRFFQALEVMAHRRLFHLAAERSHQIADAKPFAAQLEANLLARVVAQRFGEVHKIKVHRLTMVDDALLVKSNWGLERGKSRLYAPSLAALDEPVLRGCKPLRNKQGNQRQQDQNETGPNRRVNVALEHAIDQQRHGLRPSL